MAQLRDLHPANGIEAQVRGLHLVSIITKDDQENLKEEEIVFRKLGEFVFEDREVILESGKKVKFKKMPGDIAAALHS